MKKVLGLLGILTLATSLTSGRNPKSDNLGLNSRKAAEGRVAPVCIVPAIREEKILKVGYALPASSIHSPPAPVIAQHLSQTSTVPLPMPLWLSELNQWRRMAGLRVVTENAHLSYGSEEHARYLVAQGPADTAGFRAYDRSIGPGAHLESSRRPSYTAAGAEAAMGGPLEAGVIQGADVAWEGRSESDDIDDLMLAPFHRMSLLAPWAQIGGYGTFGEYPRRAAALALRGPLEAQREGHPIEFPPANADLSINALTGSEWPNPIAGCAGYERPFGLPITLQVSQRLVLQSYSLRDQTREQSLQACGFDGVSYRDSDVTQQRRGRELLNAYGAVVLIPRKPLSAGHEYRVTMQTSRGSFEWAFGLKGAKDAVDVETAQTPPAATRQVLAVEVIGRIVPAAGPKVRVGITPARRRW
jgi:hypothetical protein